MISQEAERKLIAHQTYLISHSDGPLLCSSSGVRSGGLLGNFIGGMQRGLRKNANDVFEYGKRSRVRFSFRIYRNKGGTKEWKW